MRSFRVVIASILAIVVIAIGALAVFPPKAFVKGRFAAQVKAATGRELAMRGATSLRLLPSFVLRVEDVELMNAPGTTGDPLFAAHAVLIEGALWPLITGRNVLDRVSIEGPHVVLATDANGAPNWAMPPGAGPAIVARSVTFAGGELTYRDRASNRLLRLRGVDGTFWDLAGDSIGQLELQVGEATVRAAAGPELIFATVDAEARAIVAGTAGEVTIKAANVLYRQGAGAAPVKLEAAQVTAKPVSPSGPLDAAVAAVWNGERVTGEVRLPALAALLEVRPSLVAAKIAELLEKGAEKGVLSPQATEALEALKARAQGN